MPILLSNEEIQSFLTMKDVLSALEISYRELSQNIAINRSRSDLHIPNVQNDAVYRFKTMEGAVPGLGVLALRLNSDVMQWPTVNGVQRQEKIPAAQGRWMGLIQLFSIETGELLAMMPDGVVQRMRVGGANGIGAKYMARKDASKVGLIGSGWQAGAQLMALCEIRPIRLVKVYSTTAENRVRFAKEMSEMLGIEVIPVDSPAEAIEGTDIINTATNSMTPVLFADQLSEGVHVSSIKRFEIDGSLFDRADRVVIHTKEGKGPNYMNKQIDGDKIPYLNKDPFKKLNMHAFPELPQLVTGEITGRENDQEITMFQNNIGLGTQFAAVAAKVYEIAKAKGIGREFPLEWFTQDVHP